MSGVRVMRCAEHRRMRWANGGGWTTEVVAWPDPEAWVWRLSLADVATDGPFSRFPGIDRTIALIGGAGFALTIDGRPEHVIDRPLRPFHFDGGAVTSCRLLDGPVQDLNLMVRRGAVDLELAFVTVAGPADPDDGTIAPGTADGRRGPDRPVSVIGPSGTELALVVAGSARLGSHDLGPLDAIRPDGRPIEATALGSGPCVVALIRGRHGPG